MFELEKKDLEFGDWVISLEEVGIEDKEKLRLILLQYDEDKKTLEGRLKSNALLIDVMLNGVKVVKKGDEIYKGFGRGDLEGLLGKLGGYATNILLELLSLGQITEDDKKK